MLTSTVTELNPLPGIAEVYEAIRGESLIGEGDERRGYCLNVQHPDSSPSCDYNVHKDVFHCKACEASGGIIALAIVSGIADDSRAAIKWFRSKKLMMEQTEQARWDTVSVIYQYLDDNGELLYEVGRWDLGYGRKMFSQRAPDGNNKGGWKPGRGALDGVKRVPFMLTQLNDHIKAGAPGPVFVVEGEKDANNLYKAGAVATTNAQGARWNWPTSWAEYFRGVSTVYVLADNDEPGQLAAERRASLIATVVPNVRIVQTLPGVGEKGDVSDWLNINRDALKELYAICEASPKAIPYRPPYDATAVSAIVRDLSDIGSARWFTRHYEKHAKFIKEVKSWFAYEEGVWNLNPYRVAAWGIDAVDALKAAAEDYSGDKQNEFTKYATDVRQLTRRKNMLETAASLNLAKINIFDTHPDLLNCANGTVDLTTLQIRPFDPDDFLTLQTPVEFDPDATCENFEAWLRSCVTDKTGAVDEALFEYMQMVMGSCLEGKPGLRAFYFIVGDKGTGKSTFVKILEEMLGPYQCATDFTALTESRFGSDGGSASPQFAMLRGKRMVSAAEAKGNARLDAARIKQLIGGDTITARFLNQDLFQFKFEATLIMTGNEMPRIVGDESIWDKFKPVPFDHSIESEDPDFVQNRLLPEMSGILNFAIAGLHKLRAAKYKPFEPIAVTQKRAIEFAEQDTFKDFVDQCIEKAEPKDLGKWTAVDGSAVRELFVSWCKRQSNPGLAPKAFKAAMKRHGIEEGTRGGQLTWKNIRLKQPETTGLRPPDGLAY